MVLVLVERFENFDFLDGVFAIVIYPLKMLGFRHSDRICKTSTSIHSTTGFGSIGVGAKQVFAPKTSFFCRSRLVWFVVWVIALGRSKCEVFHCLLQLPLIVLFLLLAICFPHLADLIDRITANGGEQSNKAQKNDDGTHV